jgi:plasmid stabilization system protein ParE
VERLHDRLFENNPFAADRLLDVLTRAFESLGEISERGRPVDAEGLRELIVPFGGSSCVVRYEPTSDRVRVARVWHGLEDRRP